MIRPNRAPGVHIEIDEDALGRLTTNALALGNVGLNLGLRAAAEGLEEARRDLEDALREPGLSGTVRRETEQALAATKRELARAG